MAGEWSNSPRSLSQKAGTAALVMWAIIWAVFYLGWVNFLLGRGHALASDIEWSVLPQKPRPGKKKEENKALKGKRFWLDTKIA